MKALALRLSLSFTIILSLSLSILIHFYQDRVNDTAKVGQAQALFQKLKLGLEVEGAENFTPTTKIGQKTIKSFGREIEASIQYYSPQALLIFSSYPTNLKVKRPELLLFSKWQEPIKNQNYLLAKYTTKGGDFYLAQQAYQKTPLPEIFDLWLVTALVGALVAFLFLWSELRPLSKLSQSSGNLAGEFATSANAIDQIQLNFEQMEKALKENLEHDTEQKIILETIFAAMEDSLILFDEDWRIKSINKAALDMLDIRANNSGGLKLTTLFRNPLISQLAAQCLEKKETLSRELELHHGNLFVKIQFTPLQLPKGEGILLALRDLSQLSHLEGVRKEFVANVSHELKTPITSIQGFSETLLDGALKNEATAEKFLTIIHQHSLRMSAIIEDLLSLARIEENTSTGVLDKEPHKLLPIAQRAFTMVEGLSRKKGIKVTIDIDEQMQALVNPPLIEQCLANLISNAIKYSPENTNILLLGKKGLNVISIAVSDQGEGIPSKDLSRVFERFYRVDKSRSRKTGGTGLGLSIVKNIVKLHQGEISLESKIGQGSTFTINLPFIE
ncbi:MAG: ATP-binding protein [SAR324 cluster bacterium]|nr:ATP-binding protein [SAR324 cluster bacterium]